MGLTTVEPSPSPLEPATANERFRGRDRSRLHRCVALSAGIHVLLVLAWPELSPPSPEAGGVPGATPLELVALAPGRPPGDGLVAVPLASEEAGSRPGGADAEDEEGDEDRDDGGAGGPAARGDRRTEALDRIAAATPGVVRRRPGRPTDPVPEEPPEVEPSEVEASGAEEPEGGDVRIGAASSRLQGRLSEEERLRLERLSSVRPGLAFGSMSDWVLVRNPSTVNEFMRRRFGSARRAGDHGTLSVSLWIDEHGSVQWAEINSSSGRPDLDESALELFEEVIAFVPARKQGMGVPTAAIIWLKW